MGIVKKRQGKKPPGRQRSVRKRKNPAYPLTGLVEGILPSLILNSQLHGISVDEAIIIGALAKPFLRLLKGVSGLEWECGPEGAD